MNLYASMSASNIVNHRAVRNAKLVYGHMQMISGRAR